MQIPKETTEQRITLHTIFLQVLEQLNLEKGLGYTIKALTLYPGKAIKEYLFHDRKKLIRPFQFILLMAAIATFLTHFILPMGDAIIEELHQSKGWENIPISARPIVEFLSIYSQKYFNIFYMSTLPVSSLASYWVLKKHKLHFAEHLVLNTYIFSYQTIFYILLIPFVNLANGIALFLVALTFFYAVYAFISLFDLSIKDGIIKSILIFISSQLLSLILGIIVFLILWWFFPI